MIYDKLTVALFGALSTERQDSANAHIARYLLRHQSELGGLSVKRIAASCNVGVGSVSRFCRDVGFGSFDELRREFCSSARRFEGVGEGGSARERATRYCEAVSSALGRAAASVDYDALDRLVTDLASYARVSAYGMLKAQAAAVDLQTDLLMQGTYVETCVNHAEQLRRIAEARRDELVVVFSYTGSYFDSRDLTESMRRVDRPKVWVVCGMRHRLPAFVSDRLLFESAGTQLGHPYQLELVAGIIAQEFAHRRARGE